MLGFYPMCPGKDEFTVTGCLADGAEICLNGKTVDLIEKTNDKCRIKYSEIMEGLCR